ARRGGCAGGDGVPASRRPRAHPVQTLLGHVVDRLPASHAAYLTGHTFFPSLISAPFEHGLAIAFDFAIVACLVAAVASLLRGGRYVPRVVPGPAARPPARPRGANAGTRTLAPPRRNGPAWPSPPDSRRERLPCEACDAGRIVVIPGQDRRRRVSGRGAR